MKRNTMTKQQLLLEMEELRTRLDTTEQRLKGANEALQAQMAEHKRMEESLEKTQQYAQSIVETIREPLVVLNADLKVISANHSFYQTFKVIPEETEGRFIYSVGNHQWDIPVLRKLLEEVVPQNTHFNDFRVDHEFPTIGQKTMLLNARRIYREGKGTEMILLAIEDITERKQTEEALNISETQYRRLFETAQDGILILDADTGQISDVNPFLVEMLGYSHEDVLGKKLWEIGAFKDMKASRAAFSELQNKGYVRYEDLPLETKEGRHIDVEFVSNVYLVDHKNVIQCNIRDITQRKQAGDELRQKTHELDERVKELNCLYAFSKLIEKPDICLPEIFQGLVDIIPSGWQYPEMTCARLVLEDQIFKTGNFMETIWKQSSPIRVDERHIGDLEVYYLEGKPEFEEGPFLKEERTLINDLAGRLGKTIKRIRGEEALQKAHDVLEQRVKERTAQLKRANEQLIQEMEEHKQAEEEKARHHRRLEGLWKITRNIDADYKPLYDMVLGEIIEMTQSRFGFYGFINEDESVMTIHSWSKEAMEDCKVSDKPIEFPIAKAGLWGEAVRRRKILIVNDYKGVHPGKKGTPEGHVSLTRILTVPVFSHGRIIALATISNKPTDYTEDDAEQINAFMTHLQVILERRQAQEALQESEHRLRLLSSQLLAVQEAERKRVARELHDGIGQTLTAIKFKIEDTLREKGRGQSGSKKTSLESLNEMVKKSIEEVRKIQMDLRPSTLDDLGILATISWFTREFVRIYSSLHIEKRIDLQEDEVPDSLKTIIFRVVQESLNNTAKHSKAEWVYLSLQKTDGRIELRIEDNGMGFDLKSTLSLKIDERGYGLSSMRERVEFSGGSFAVESTQGKGTLIQASWRLQQK
jgi:PAS domain S-box-containing protein